MRRVLRGFDISAFSLLALLALVCVSRTCSAQSGPPPVWQAVEYFEPYAVLHGSDPVALAYEVAIQHDLDSCTMTYTATCAGDPSQMTCGLTGPPTVPGQYDICQWSDVIIQGPAYN